MELENSPTLGFMPQEKFSKGPRMNLGGNLQLDIE